jgi:UDP-N-acetyl-D-glucosamine dehydrogenase
VVFEGTVNMFQAEWPAAEFGKQVLVDPIQSLEVLLDERKAVVGVCGLGYVGLPLAVAIAEAGFNALGFDIDERKIAQLEAGVSYVGAVKGAQLEQLKERHLFRATSDSAAIGSCDVVIMCVPTPLTPQREPDLSILIGCAKTVAANLRAGQLVILESTTYPGTTNGVFRPILERTGLRSGQDFLLGYSPEREDPAGLFHTRDIPKVVAGDGPRAQAFVRKFYSSVIDRVVPVSRNEVAEAVKITENIFRFVNIGLVNELKSIYSAMDIDIWEVIEAAKTKPFGFMPFYPGPGLGGHCIPVDPFYLTWKAREFDIATRFVELAGEVNQAAPRQVVEQLRAALDQRLGLPLSRASIMVVGVAYKKNISDVRESPSLKIIEMLAPQAWHVVYHDPHVRMIETEAPLKPPTTLASTDLDVSSIEACDALLIATDHDDVDYALLEKHAKLIIDTRNAMEGRGICSSKVVKA